jgi:hypothetical protein
MADEPEPEIVLKMPSGEIQAFDLPREIARKIALYRRVRALGFSEEEAKFLLTADTF